MLAILRSKIVTPCLLVVSPVLFPVTAQAYPVDCAILLCLAGGWPASVECSHARAVFIRRITPWPIEPPLQIWRCPMGSTFMKDSTNPFESRLYKALERSKTLQGQGDEQPDNPPEATMTPLVYKLDDNDAQVALDGLLTKISQQADIDISDPAFDFVRSLRVYHMQFRQDRDRDSCTINDNSRLGFYGPQGEYRWRRHKLVGVTYERVRNDDRGGGWQDIPHYSWIVPAQSSINRINFGSCNSINIRAVGVSWTDWEGNPGYEEVHY